MSDFGRHPPLCVRYRLTLINKPRLHSFNLWLFVILKLYPIKTRIQHYQHYRTIFSAIRFVIKKIYINFVAMLGRIKNLISKIRSIICSSNASTKRIVIDIGYVFAWGVITLASSYCLLLHHCSFDFIINPKDDYNYIIIPLIVWMVAYFLDYVYNTIRKEKDELISISAIKEATVAITIFLFCLVIILA